MENFSDPSTSWDQKQVRTLGKIACYWTLLKNQNFWIFWDENRH